jgi:hypothetical protein
MPEEKPAAKDGDSAFVDDVVKTNASVILNQYDITTVRSL